MDPAEDLRYEHEVLRGKLAMVEEFLPSFCDAPFLVAQLTDALAACWHAHTEREERLLDALMRHRYEPPPVSLQRLHDEHENQRMRLAVLHTLITAGGAASGDQVATQAGYLIKELREHMAREEEEMFPVIGRPVAAAPRGEADMAEEEGELCLTGLA